MLRILAIFFALTTASNIFNPACDPLSVGGPKRRRIDCGGQGNDGGVYAFIPTRQEEGDAEDKEDMKKGKMYKKFSEMSKKKLMQMIKKYEKKIAIMKKVLKAKKKEKEN